MSIFPLSRITPMHLEVMCNTGQGTQYDSPESAIEYRATLKREGAMCASLKKVSELLEINRGTPYIADTSKATNHTIPTQQMLLKTMEHCVSL